MRDNKKSYHFTVVIPTRERCDTLEHSLHTCVMQDYDNLDILVSDNLSRDRTREVVESYRDNRIRYINTGKRLSMSGNYEFALSHVRPEGYVIYIGDDDGLLPNAISDLNDVIIKTGARVLRWYYPDYGWPSLKDGSANKLHIPSLGTSITKVDSARALQKVVSFDAQYDCTLPMLYLTSAVEYQVIKRIKDISITFYHSYAPDIYSGFAIAGAVDWFFNSLRPYTIAGVSNHSTGASQFGRTSSEVLQNFLGEDNLPIHSSMFWTKSIRSCTTEAFLQARDHLPFFDKIAFDMRQLLLKMMEEASRKSQNIYTEIEDEVLRLGRKHNIPEAAQQAIALNPRREPGSGRKPTVSNLVRAGLLITRQFLSDYNWGGSIDLDCSSLNINHIYDASILCGHILSLKDKHFLGYFPALRLSLSNVARTILPKKTPRN
jgi:glycosyltransferase involved in cell wall biosynthesis